MFDISLEDWDMTALLVQLALFSITIEQEIATKKYWIGLNDIIHNFNKTVNAKPSTATTEMKNAIAKIRSMQIKHVDSLVLIYSEKRIKLASDYVDFLESIKIDSDDFFKTDFPIKKQKDKIENIQKKYQYFYEQHKDIDTEQQVLVAYLKEKYNIDSK